MKLVLISDIHSNVNYLESVLKEIDMVNPDAVYCLGDIIGYYDNPDLSIELIRKLGIVAIKGNHEKFILNELTYDKNKEKLYRINKQKMEISEESLNFLKNLPDYLEIEICEKNIYMTHSLPNDSLKYAYSPSDFNGYDVSPFDFYFYGHTHIPNFFVKKNTMFLNPGSVGQPRDHTALPSFGVVEFYKNSFLIKKVNIDIKSYLEILKQKKFPKELINILNRKKSDGKN